MNQKNITFNLGFVLCILSLLNACASIVKGKSEDIRIATPSNGMKLTVYDLKNNNFKLAVGESPLNLNLRTGAGLYSRAEYKVVAENAKGESAETIVSTKLRLGWYLLGNLAFFGADLLVGLLVVDPYTGAMWGFEDPENTIVNSPPETSSPSSSKDVNGKSEFNDIVVLKNGDILDGVKTVVTAKELVVTDSQGNTTVYPKKDVLSVKKKK